MEIRNKLVLPLQFPLKVKSITFPNRVVMSPMSRNFSPNVKFSAAKI